jgi:hypothetical protein
MGGPSYSLEQLEALRESPLVKKPEGLPNISQWMDVPADQNNNQQNNNGTARRTRGAMRELDGGVPTEQRPIVNPMGQFGRRQSMRKSEAHGMVAAINALFVEPGEDTVLGPPKLNFASASRIKAPGEAKERTGIVSTDGDNLGDRFPREKNERWTRGGDAERTRDKAFTNGRRPPREDGGDGWTVAKGRKSVGQEDFERFGGRNGDRTREKQEGDVEIDAARRGNRDRPEPRWGRREETKDEGTKVGVQGGWRERDQNRERDSGRDWTRGGRAEEDPEWMDTKVEKKEAKMHTAEDFQRWKESMKAKDAPAEDRNEYTHMAHDVSTATAATVPPMLTQPLHTPSTEPTQGILFGNWGRDKAAEMSPAETMSAKAKPDKKSRFMNMFAKPEEPAAPSQPSMPTPASPPPPPEASADQEGFQRILQMLGQANLGGLGGSSPQPSAPAPTNGARHGGGISLESYQQSPPPEPQNSRPPRTLEQQSILENILAQRPTPESRQPQQSRYSSMSPDNVMQDQFRLPRESSQPEPHFTSQQAPSRGPIPDVNLNAILSGRARVESAVDQDTKQKERDFLLTLMQQPSRGTPPQLANHNLPRQHQENHLAAFFDQPRQQPQAPPKGRPGLPPGFMEDHRMFNENDMARREAERREQEIRQQLSMQQQQQEAMRAKNARMPMGFAGHDDTIMNLQRRGTAGDSRQLTNMGIPSQPIPDMSYMSGRGQPGMPPSTQERSNIPPPPGFGGPMRQPPGLNAQQQMGPGPSFSAGNTPIGHPPGFAPPGNMRGMGFPSAPGVNGMHGPPQGYFPPPPGYAMGGMPREDPRMMFDGPHPGFGAPGPRQPQQGRPGPPGMY